MKLWLRKHTETTRNNRFQLVAGKAFNSKYLETTNLNTSQQGLESGSGPGGRRFKSSRPDHSFHLLSSAAWFFVYSGVDNLVDAVIACILEALASLSQHRTVRNSQARPFQSEAARCGGGQKSCARETPGGRERDRASSRLLFTPRCANALEKASRCSNRACTRTA